MSSILKALIPWLICGWFFQLLGYVWGKTLLARCYVEAAFEAGWEKALKIKQPGDGQS